MSGTGDINLFDHADAIPAGEQRQSLSGTEQLPRWDHRHVFLADAVIHRVGARVSIPYAQLDTDLAMGMFSTAAC